MMSNVLVLCRPEISHADLTQLPPLPTPEVTSNSLRFTLPTGFALPESAAKSLLAQQIDWGILPDQSFSDFGLLVSDMDSTLITIECIDEIAAASGLKSQVAEITERSMQGELDFEQSLRERVALLKGLPENVLDHVYNQVLQLSPGAEILLNACKTAGIKFMLVSGGFTFFTDRLKADLGLNFAYANELEIDNGILTGRVKGRIIDASAKAELLNQHRQQLNLTPQQVIAMGDGANDIPMLEAAGIGIAYHAKPKAATHADVCIRFGGLDTVPAWFR